MNIDLTLSPETEALLAALKDVPLGGDISYRALTAKIGRDVTGAARAKLASARTIALRDYGIGFTAIRGEGLRRIRPEEAPGMGTAARTSIRSKARRASRGIKSVIAASNGVDAETQRRAAAEISSLGLLAEIAGNKAQVAFEAKEPMAPALAGAKFLRHIGAANDLFDGEV